MISEVGGYFNSRKNGVTIIPFGSPRNNRLTLRFLEASL